MSSKVLPLPGPMEPLLPQLCAQGSDPLGHARSTLRSSATRSSEVPPEAAHIPCPSGITAYPHGLLIQTFPQ